MDDYETREILKDVISAMKKLSVAIFDLPTDEIKLLALHVIDVWRRESIELIGNYDFEEIGIDEIFINKPPAGPCEE